MKRNLGNTEPILRAVAGAALLLCSVMAPISLAMRMLILAVPGSYALLTALAGTCLGYQLLGKSTCPLERADES